MGGVALFVQGDAIIDNVTIRVSVCLGSSGSAPEAAKARIVASASATPLAPRSYRCFESALKWSVAMRSMFQIRTMNSANSRVDVHIDPHRLIGDNGEGSGFHPARLGFGSSHIQDIIV